MSSPSASSSLMTGSEHRGAPKAISPEECRVECGADLVESTDCSTEA